MSTIVHPRIAADKVEERRYQTSMVEGCIRSDMLLILPTALGKTIIALRTAVEFLPKGKVLIMAPTKPLLDQHLTTFTTLMTDPKVCVINGSVPAKKRSQLISDNEVVIATPQTVSNDLREGRYDLSAFSFIIYDEAHRAVGDYAYVTVAKYVAKGTRCVGMTASPGANMNKIKEVCINLGLRRVDARTENDRDVAPYVHNTEINHVRIRLPGDLIKITALLRQEMDHYVSELISLGLMDRGWPASKTHFLAIQRMLQMRLSSGEKTAVVYRGLSLEAMCMKLYHAIELAETQGTAQLRAYLSRLEEESKEKRGGRSAKEIIGRQEYADMRKILDSTNVQHPKLTHIMTLISRMLDSDPGSKVMVFAHYRETCDMLCEKIPIIPGARVGKLIGQSGDGLSQKEQIELLDRLRSGEINVIVSTSVGEEGLDISSTNAVIFYEPVPSEIRTIQRRGRTGRKNDGSVYVLIADGTMDDVALRTSEHKEESMRESIDKLNYELSRGYRIIPDTEQKFLDGF